MKQNLNQRPVDLLTDKITPWWKKTLEYTRQKEVATWKGSLLLVFIFGLVVSLIWGAKTDYYVTSVAAPSSTLYFNPASTSVASGADFTLNAVVNPGTNKISVAELHITFDQTKLSLTSITVPSAPADCAATPTFSTVLKAASINNTNGTASVTLGGCMVTPMAPVVATTTVATFNFHALAIVSNSSVTFTTESVAAAIGELDNVITTRTGAQVTIVPADSVPPAGGSISYTNGYLTNTSVSLNVNDGTDASGIKTSSRAVQRRSATLASGTCGAFGSWASITPTGTYPNFADATVVTGNCYQYQYLVSDNATPANQATYPSTSVAKIDTGLPTGGALSFADGFNKTHSIALTVSDGTDSVSGINTASRIVQRRSAAISAGACGAYGAWGNITPTGTYPNFADATVVTGNCYQYQYLVSDNAGKQSVSTSSSVAKITYEADLTLDGSVNIFDYNILFQYFGDKTCGNIADIVANCSVDIFDYNQLFTTFGQSLVH